MIYTVSFKCSTVNKRKNIRTHEGTIEIDTNDRTAEEMETLHPVIKAKITKDVMEQKKRIVTSVEILCIESKIKKCQWTPT